MTLVYFDSFFFIFFGSFIVCSLVFTVSFFCLGGTIEDIALLLSLLCRIALRLRIYFFSFTVTVTRCLVYYSQVSLRMTDRP